jgi:hypothetical protein
MAKQGKSSDSKEQDVEVVASNAALTVVSGQIVHALPAA